MIAHHQDETFRQYAQSNQAHAEAIEQDQQVLTDKLNQMLTAKPMLSLATAVGMGMVIGWLFKRKEW
ncbi:hypothetical protein Q31b_54190 [Novipirellula aureliae]|uniref:DUF883 domain-containing protein n=1 Tax=Novipirellula aureliae TaxID=2527966 RepID=A0A5C6DDK4_9BACT|nr:hypothetical protein [Novipirellula aureliae]TWU35323.1 hypothetical protein Q31b_54190 [Novipirellula aureliae]